MNQYRKKPVVIEAVHYVSDSKECIEECMNFCPGLLFETYRANGTLTIPTLEGKMLATLGDWIIKGIKGEFYPCKPDIFEATYEKVNPPNTYHFPVDTHR